MTATFDSTGPLGTALALIIVGGFLLGAIASLVLGLRHGRRLPPLSPHDYRRQAIFFFAAPFLLFGLTVAISNLGAVLIAFPLWIVGLFYFQYRLTRCSVQRLSDIQGRTYRGLFRALLSYQPLMILYLCYRRGAVRQVDVEMF
jgi:hypothetical protein